MAYLAIDNDGQEVLFASFPKYNKDEGGKVIMELEFAKEYLCEK